MEEVQAPTVQPISDDQELAEALAGVQKQTEATMGFEETPIPTVAPAAPAVEEPVEPITPLAVPAVMGEGENLDGIKHEALLELRPLVDKLNLAPEDKFDTYLLLLRSTDDKTLIAPAHLAAQEIADETRRAQALLEIIKEIDFLSGATPQV